MIGAYPTLIDARNRTETNNGRYVINTIFQLADVMGFLPLAVRPNMKSTLLIDGVQPAMQHRAMNDTFTATRAEQAKPLDTDLTVGGALISIDPEYADIPQLGMEAYEQQQIRKHTRGMALDMPKHLIGRSPSRVEPKGCYDWIDEYYSATNNPIKVPINAAVTKLSAITSQQIVLKLDTALNAIYGANIGFADESVIRALKAISQTAAATAFASYFTVNEVAVPGMPEKKISVGSYSGVPIFPIGRDSQGSAIMPYDEDIDGVVGGGSATSIVFARLGLDDGFKQLVKRMSPVIEKYRTAGCTNIEIRWPYNFEAGPQSVSRVMGILTE